MLITVVKIYRNMKSPRYAENAELNAVWSDFNPDILHTFDIFDKLGVDTNIYIGIVFMLC